MFSIINGVQKKKSNELKTITVIDQKVAKRICQMCDAISRAKEVNGGACYEASFELWTYIRSVYPDIEDSDNWSIKFTSFTKPVIFQRPEEEVVPDAKNKK
jgi:hypothetical protein